MKNNIPLWNFFASVKLALFTLISLSVTSIIGTIIPQKESFSAYASKYGESTAKLFQVLNIGDMYNSWWFMGLLGLLCINLIICSLDRFPNVLKQIKADNLSMPLRRLERMNQQSSWSSEQSHDDTVESLKGKISDKGWTTEKKVTEDGTLLFSQKGAWSRTGVYIVHISILVIFIGAIIGSFLGFKAWVMIPEGSSAETVRAFYSKKIIDLGFTLRCDRFDIEYYQNGMPKDYRSNLSVIENGNIVQQTEIEVNSPLTYKGITFYQSSYEGSQFFLIKITNTETGNTKSFTLPFQKQVMWAEEGVTFGILNAKQVGQNQIVEVKIWLKDEISPPSVFWMDAGNTATVVRKQAKYTLEAKQMFATGLQVARDPGVWLVYIGFTLMLFGLGVAFFLSHQRIWLFVAKGDKPTVLLAGSANKNRLGFEKRFDSLSQSLKKS